LIIARLLVLPLTIPPDRTGRAGDGKPLRRGGRGEVSIERSEFGVRSTDLDECGNAAML
jgi:hypothetical protein